MHLQTPMALAWAHSKPSHNVDLYACTCDETRLSLITRSLPIAYSTIGCEYEVGPDICQFTNLDCSKSVTFNRHPSTAAFLQYCSVVYTFPPSLSSPWAAFLQYGSEVHTFVSSLSPCAHSAVHSPMPSPTRARVLRSMHPSV